MDDHGHGVFLEVKNTTLRMEDCACFPDAVTARGAKHLRELQGTVEMGQRAGLVFLVNRGDVDRFDAARTIDPAYAESLERAAAAGVEVIPLQVTIKVEPDSDGFQAASWSICRVLPWIRGA